MLRKLYEHSHLQSPKIEAPTSNTCSSLSVHSLQWIVNGIRILAQSNRVLWLAVARKAMPQSPPKNYSLRDKTFYCLSTILPSIPHCRVERRIEKLSFLCSPRLLSHLSESFPNNLQTSVWTNLSPSEIVLLKSWGTLSLPISSSAK